MSRDILSGKHRANFDGQLRFSAGLQQDAIGQEARPVFEGKTLQDPDYEKGSSGKREERLAK